MLLARQREAVALRKNGQLADAEVQLRLLTADLADRAGADHAATLSTSATHAAVLNDLGQHAEAVAEGQAALRSSTSALGADHPVTRELAATLARIDSQP